MKPVDSARGKPTTAQGRDTGMAAVLILLLVAITTGRQALVGGATVVLVLVMAAPGLFRPLAIIWFGLSHVLGYLSSRVLLSAVFLLVVTPMGLVRRLLGKDALRLRQFKRGQGSVFITRDHTFTARDLERPY